MDEKIKVILLCGFLGSGKTTLLSSLLTDKGLSSTKKAVLVNDFGALPVDAALLPEGNFYVSKLNKGSLFCVCVKSELLKMIEKIAIDIKPEILFIEATGLAEPKDFLSLVTLPHLEHKFSSGPILCVVDAVNFLKLSSMLPALISQAAIADCVLINKIDKVSKTELEKIESSVRSVNPDAYLIKTSYCKCSFDDLNILGNEHKLKKRETEIQEKCMPPAYTEKYEFRSNKSIKEKQFIKVLKEYQDIILRAKGIVEFDNRRCYIEVINGEIELHPGKIVNIETKFASAVSFILKSCNRTKLFNEAINHSC